MHLSSAPQLVIGTSTVSRLRQNDGSEQRCNASQSLHVGGQSAIERLSRLEYENYRKSEAMVWKRDMRLKKP